MTSERNRRLRCISPVATPKHRHRDVGQPEQSTEPMVFDQWDTLECFRTSASSSAGTGAASDRLTFRRPYSPMRKSMIEAQFARLSSLLTGIDGDEG